MLEHSAPDIVVVGLTVLLGFVVVPVWLAMGFADYFCHRASEIERTSGTRESILHLVQFVCLGVPLTAALFLEVDGALLMLMFVFVVLHHAVAYIDVRYANATRRVLPIEQMVHSFLELLPIAALLLVSALDFAQLAAWFGKGALDFGIRLRNPALPIWYVGFVLGGALVMGLLPYLEELMRCMRADPNSRIFQHAAGHLLRPQK
jgi:hypothetical protein